MRGEIKKEIAMPKVTDTDAPKKRKKTGGRKAGTPNKVTQVSKEALASMLSSYIDSGQMGDDFQLIEPKERLMIAEKMMQYLLPKVQSVSIETTESKDTSAEEKLRQLVQVKG